MSMKIFFAIFFLLILVQNVVAIIRPGTQHQAHHAKCIMNMMAVSPEINDTEMPRRWQKWIFESHMQRRRMRTICPFMKNG